MPKMLQAVCLVALPAMALAQAAPNPWFGTWKLRLKHATEQPETLIYSDAGRGAMRMVSVEQGSVIVTRFDGKVSRDIGHGGREPTLAVRAVSPTSYRWTYYRAGRPYVQGVNTLSADRRRFMETSWLVTKPDKLVTLTYDRQ